MNAISAEELNKSQNEAPYVEVMKDYLFDNTLPDDKDLAARVIRYHERYDTQNQILYIFGFPSVKETRKQLVVPPKERCKLLMHHHEVGYPGFQRTLSRLQEN